MNSPFETLAQESQWWLDIISSRRLGVRRRQRIAQKTLENFRSYYNRGVLHYSKAVAEANGMTAIEWSGHGSAFSDLEGREYIDCLGGYGIYSAGIRHPKIVKAVGDQLQRMPLSSQELLDPLRGALSHLLGELAPGELQNCFFINNGTDAVEGAMKLARLYTGKPGFIACLGGFHGKSYGSLSLMGKAEYRQAFEPLLTDVYFVPFGSADAVEAELRKAEAVGEQIAAVVAEPIQGEAGAIVPPDDYWPRLRELCAGTHRPDLRPGPLGCRAGHSVSGQGARRRGNAAERVHVDATHLEGARAESLHPLIDVRGQPARMRGRHRRHQRDAGGGSRGAGSPQRLLYAGTLARDWDALSGIGCRGAW